MGWGSPEGEAAPAGRQSGKEGRNTPKHTQADKLTCNTGKRKQENSFSLHIHSYL